MDRILSKLIVSVILVACSPVSNQEPTNDKAFLNSGTDPSAIGAQAFLNSGTDPSAVGAPVPMTGLAPAAQKQMDMRMTGIKEKLGLGSDSGLISIEALLGRINPAKDANFVRIEAEYTSKSGIYMRKEAYEAFKEMHAAAKADGVNLNIVSATRTFGAQKGIWERKWTGATKVNGQNLAYTTPDPIQRAKSILTYSSMPGTSRHHWGTDIDLNNLNNAWFESGAGKEVYNWLTLNAGVYGFCQTYTVLGEDRPHGYLEERWHWSFTPLSGHFFKDYIAQVKHSDINGFKGSEVAGDVDVIGHYVSGVNPACKGN